jgi:protein TonB
MMAATMAHFLVFQLSPVMVAADFSDRGSPAIEVLPPLPEIDLPPEPDAIPRPATPVIGEIDVDPDITIPSTDPRDHPPDLLPPPRAPESPTAAAGPRPFTPFSVAPRLINQPEVERVLLREYPPTLRDARVGGQALVWFLIDEEGRVQRTRLNRSSGHVQLDEAALRVAGVMRFTPAMNRDQRVAVWVSMPVTFRVP